MKVYVDTNVVVADAVSHHVHNANASSLFQEIRSRRWTPVISAHGLAEIYSVLTGTPYRPRISSAEAWQIINENVLAEFEIEAFSKNDYRKLIQDLAALGVTGGRIYDALHLHAARKAECRRIYTFNIQHFRQLAPDLLDHIMAP